MSNVLVTVIALVSLAIFIVFLIYNLLTFGLIALSFFEDTLMKEERGDLFRLPRDRPFRPGITVIACAYNERPVIVASAARCWRPITTRSRS